MTRVLYRTQDGVVRVDFSRSVSQPSVDDEARQLAEWLHDVARRRDEQQRSAAFWNAVTAIGAVLAFLGVLAWGVP